MKKVLFIIQSYPSNKSANVLCDEKIMNVMRDSGMWEIHTLSYKYHNQPLNEIVNGYSVHRFNRGWWWNFYTYARDNQDKTWGRFVYKFNRILIRIQQILSIPVYPNDEPWLAKQYAQEAIRLHTKERFDLIVAEHHGRDCIYAGGCIKDIDSKVKTVALLWDPMSGRTLAGYLPKDYAQRKNDEDESKLLKRFDLIFMMNSYKNYQEKFSVAKEFYSRVKYLDIPGIVKPVESGMTQSYTIPGKINILYSGILTVPDRDPSKIIQILASSKYANKFNLMFFSFGNGTEIAKKLLEQYGLGGFVHGYIPKCELDAVIRDSDFLLNIGGPNPQMVPSKIFEYMSSGKPILSTYYNDNETSLRYFEKYPLSICVDTRNDINSESNKLDNLICNVVGKSVPFEEMSSVFPDNCPSAYVDAISNLMEL